MSLSRSQQKPCFGSGPESLEEPLRGSLVGSGNDARCVGGGDPDAADRVVAGPRGPVEGVGALARDPSDLSAALRSLSFAGVTGREGFGDVWNGLGESAMVMRCVCVWPDVILAGLALQDEFALD